MCSMSIHAPDAAKSFSEFLPTMKFPIVCLILLLAVAKTALGSLNPFVPSFVAQKNLMVKCPMSCSSARDCFLVHPMSDSHFYSCFQGKAMVHQCPSGKSFSDEKHQCVTENKNSDSTLSTAKINKLTQKIVQFEHLVESFQAKMEKVQNVIIESDNKIGMLGKFMLKAIKENRKSLCDKEESNFPFGETADVESALVEPEPMQSKNDDSEKEGIALGETDDQQKSADAVKDTHGEPAMPLSESKNEDEASSDTKSLPEGKTSE